jgi:D-beta-D-heptose 7-phosphate kinase/D-beta-D-heptose 1-phosphate adenosyltransferase
MIIKLTNLTNLKKEETVCTVGSWDIFHRGHLDFLKKIKMTYPTYKLVVGILDDKGVKSNKGEGRPIMGQKDRVKIIDAIRYVDYAFICPHKKNIDKNIIDILSIFRPKYVVFPSNKFIRLESKIKEVGGKIVIFPKTSNHSTSRIIGKIRQYR